MARYSRLQFGLSFNILLHSLRRRRPLRLCIPYLSRSVDVVFVVYWPQHFNINNGNSSAAHPY